MVSIIKIVAVTAAVFAVTASAAKCTAKQLKEIQDTTPDTETCTKYWSAAVKSPGKEALCKDETCEASIRRMTKTFPDCTNNDGTSTKAVFESDLKYCDATAAKCTAAEIKKLTDATPDREACTKYYSTSMSPSSDVFCKDTTCVASLTRLAANLPDCINAGRRVKKEILSDIAGCEKAGGSTSTPKPSSTTSTPKPSNSTATPKPNSSTSTPKPSTKTPSTKTPSSDASPSTTSSDAPATATATTTSAPTPAPTSAAFASSQASSVLLGSSLVAAVYVMAH